MPNKIQNEWLLHPSLTKKEASEMEYTRREVEKIATNRQQCRSLVDGRWSMLPASKQA